MPRRVVLAFAVLACLGWPSAMLDAQGPAPRPPAPGAIEVQVETTRSGATAGTGLGFVAYVRNTSDKTIRIHEQYFNLTLPPELEDPMSWAMYGYQGYFPEPEDPQNPEERWSNVVAIEPGDTYAVFWTPGPSASEPESNDSPQPGPRTRSRPGLFSSVWKVVSFQLRYAFFSPGKYTVTVVARYWIDPESPPDGESHTVTTSTTFTIGAPQFVILFGAGLGGLFAYLILPQGRRRILAISPGGPSWLQVIRRLAKESLGLISSMALSVIVTILLSRLSDTQFFIRVTVEDLWGAIAIGFVANYFGYKGLARLLRSENGGAPATQNVTVSPAEEPRPTKKSSTGAS